ncbi:MAG: hypothetical protein ACYSWQ_08665 [Planctomycetota bacterium]
MKDLSHCLSAVLVVGLFTGLLACREEMQEQAEPPLLLEDVEPAGELPEPTGPVADNSRCHVCHMNYEVEALAFAHARADIGCEQCHGPSDAHCSDEDNITPPDTMYSQEKINPSCMACHPREKMDIAVHKAFLADIVAGKAICTHCHGDHRLAHRTRRWDKTTGELIQDDKVRMLTDELLDEK